MKSRFKRSPLPAIIFTLHIAFFAAYIFSFKILPIQEYPDWLYQGWVFKEMVFNGNTFDGYFTFHHTLPPNALSTFIIGTLSYFVHPITAGNVFLFLCLAALYTGAIRFMKMYAREFTTSTTATYIVIQLAAFTMAFNISFFLGNNNFVFGLGIALHSCVFIRQDHWDRNIFKSAVIFFFCYITHFFALLIFLYYLSGYLIIEKGIFKNFSFKDLFKNSSFKNLCIAILPVLAIFIHYALHKSAESPAYTLEPGLWNALKPRITLLSKVLGPLPRFKGIGNDSPVKILNYAIFIFYPVALFLSFASLRQNKLLKADPAIRSLIFFVILTPIIALALPVTYQGILYPGERFVLFWGIIILTLFIISRPKFIPISAIGFAIISIILCAHLWQKTLLFKEISHSGIPVFKNDPPGLIDGFTRLVYYQAIEQKTKMPIFFSGLLKFDTSIPFRDFARPPDTIDSTQKR
ncbi:MAG: hypothetical protein V4642_08190 [Bacteroidota bacterium]